LRTSLRKTNTALGHQRMSATTTSTSVPLALHVAPHLRLKSLTTTSIPLYPIHNLLPSPPLMSRTPGVRDHALTTRVRKQSFLRNLARCYSVHDGTHKYNPLNTKHVGNRKRYRRKRNLYPLLCAISEVLFSYI
jgi:hypothetical protein